jgi:hypothetical protein
MFIEMARADDPFRVQSGSAHIADDLDPRVLFTTRWPGAFAEEHTRSVAAGGAEVVGAITFGRAYGTPPLVLGAWIAGGAVNYPFAYSYGVKVNTTAWSCLSNYVKFEVTATSLRYRICRQSGAQSGTLKVWVVG